MEQIKFTADRSGERIDRFLSENLENLSRSYIQKLLKDGKISVNQSSVKPNYKISENDKIEVFIPDPEVLDILPENIPLDILYEDSDILIVNKPKNMVVHPAPGHYEHTLVNAVMYHCKDNLSGINGILRPGIVHRIDMDTTGSLLICKNDKAHQIIAEQLKEHSITRRYHAITHYTVLRRFKDYTYIECELETGRTHQIRVHMASIGHPILGDSMYGPSKCPFKLQGQTLHAKVLGITHPSTGKYIEVDAPLPEYFNKLLKQLEER